MRALRVVGINEDGSVVLEDPGRHERYSVVADEQLRAAARGDLTRFGQISIELESQLRPREIQARIRAGASVEQVAAAAGVPAQKIERFAYPVLLERSRTAEVAQRAHPMRADGPDARVLGEVVAHTFGLRGQEYTDAGWDSWKGEDGKWVVALSWRAGRSDNRAHWTFHPGAHGGTVTALDEHASDLVEGLPVRPLRTVGPVIDIARTEEQPPTPQGPQQEELLRAAASDGTVRPSAGMRVDAARERQQAGRGAESRTSTPPAQRQAEPRPETRPAARTETRPAVDARSERVAARAEQGTVAGQGTPAGRRAAGDPRPADPRTVGTHPAPARTNAARPADPPTPDPGAAAPEPAAPAAEQGAAPAAPSTPNRRTKKGKPVMPSWDEVLLGVRGQR